MRQSCDYLVIGAGVVGVGIARELAVRQPGSKIVLIEKEPAQAMHASGRNSGVLHAGFYYTADSLKARFSRDGNRALTEYCDRNGLPIRKCGKIVVAQTEKEVPLLDELMRRAERNGVELDKISEDEARRIEPKVRTTGFALYSPSTSSVNPKQVVEQMLQDARATGVDCCFGARYLGRSGSRVQTSVGSIDARYVVNAAGLYADKIARDYGFSEGYYLLPFKGLYLYSSHPKGSLSTHIYPVPNLANPFLGVHFTVAVDGAVKIGPTAIPAFWPEQYRGMENFRLSEFTETLAHQLGLMARPGFQFHRLAFEELRKYSRPFMARQSFMLADGFTEKSFADWGIPGIRAQLVRKKSNTLEMDFVIEGDDRSMHVLNAVSPAFTCSMPFSSFVVDRIESLQ
ncbi:MAG: L-2-hydroxyglutarate oxidase [Chlorobiaceae bacterium]|nr:L-2-hydroxyglutarate oxidase [Chlorobiaceae bacterium]